MCPSADTRHGLCKFSLFYKSLGCAVYTAKASFFFFFSFFSCWSWVPCIINPTVCHINTWLIYVTWSISKNNSWTNSHLSSMLEGSSPPTMTLFLVHVTKIINSLTLDQNQLENATTCSNCQFYSSLTWKYFQIPKQICLTKLPSVGLGSVSMNSFLLPEGSLWTNPASSSNSYIVETAYRGATELAGADWSE